MSAEEETNNNEMFVTKQENPHPENNEEETE